MLLVLLRCDGPQAAEQRAAEAGDAMWTGRHFPPASPVLTIWQVRQVQRDSSTDFDEVDNHTCMCRSKMSASEKRNYNDIKHCPVIEMFPLREYFSITL